MCVVESVSVLPTGTAAYADTTFPTMTTTQPNHDSHEAEDYEITVPPHLAPKLVRLLNQASIADNAQNAIWYADQDREDIARLRDDFADQLSEQGYPGEF